MSFFQASLPNTVSAIKVAYLSRHRYTIIPTTRYTRAVLLKLVDVGFLTTISKYHSKSASRKIRGFTHKNYYKVYLNYYNSLSNFSDIILMSTNRNAMSINYKYLINFRLTRRGIIILSTPRGILTDNEAIKFRTGGIVLL